MTFSRDLIVLCAVLQDKKDELHRALALFESGIAYLDGSSVFNHDDQERSDRALYLLGLYHSTVIETLAQLDHELRHLKKIPPMAG
jgi:hypothetical protein